MAKRGEKFLDDTNDERIEIVNLYNPKNIHLYNIEKYQYLIYNKNAEKE